MKKIGLIGGMSWESTQVYYQIINEAVRERLGGFHSARCILESVDFAEIERLQHLDDWDTLNQLMSNAANTLENADADVIVLCTNTMHHCTETIVNSVRIPFLHIGEVVGKKVMESGVRKVLLLGTRYTMEKNFYTDILNQKFGIEVMVPNEHDRKLVHTVIYEELVKGHLNPDSKKEYLRIIDDARKTGANGVILGCTEIPLLIKAKDVSIPIFDTTRIHAESAVDFALND